MLMSLVWIVAISYLAICFILYFFQSTFIYFPINEVRAKPDLYQLAYEDISLTTSDGLTLSGWFVPAEAATAVVLFCHGNAGNISHRLDTLRLFHKMGLSTFIFDYRGYGLSQGKPTEQGTYFDVEAAWRYLVEDRGISPDQIIIFGRSLGGAIAAHLAQTNSPRALIVESAFSSIKDMGATIYPFLPVRLLVRFEYNTVDFLKNVSCPVLISHSKSDEMIPFKLGRQLFEAANDPKEFMEFGGSHNEGFLASGDAYQKRLAEFIMRTGTQKKED